MKRAILSAVLTLAAPTLAHAGSYDIDPVHSQVGFTVKHMMVSKVNGQFRKFTGTAEIDDKKVENSKVDVSIDAASIDTGNEKRDGHLKTPDFFDTAKYPTITFKSKSVKSVGEGKLDVTGDLTMHGVTKETVLHVTELSSDVMGPMDHKNHRGVSATTKINRKDFGLNWNAPLQQAGGVMVSDDVNINLDVEMVAKDAAAAPKK